MSSPHDARPRSQHPDEGTTDEGTTGEGTIDEGMADAIPTVYTAAGDIAAIAELAEAERASARHGATPAQAAGLAAVGGARRTEDRIARWRSGPDPGDEDLGDGG